MNNDADNIIVLCGDDGEELNFRCILKYEFNNKKYAALEPADDPDSDTVAIFRLDERDGHIFLNVIEDEKEMNAAFMEFSEIMYEDEE